MLSSVIISGCMKKDKPSGYVNPFIGCVNYGHTFPGVTLPFGLIQVSPETGNIIWKYTAGYDYKDTLVYGFAQTHLSGTGCPDLGDVLVLPLSDIKDERRKRLMNKSTETSEVGYYRVDLPKPLTTVELTATERVALHRYTFLEQESPCLLLDLQSGLTSHEMQYRNYVKEFKYEQMDDYTIVCYRKTSGWVTRQGFFVIRFGLPIASIEELSPDHKEEKGRRLKVIFPENESCLHMKVAMSTVSIANALENMKKELPEWDFCETMNKAVEKWNRYLSLIEIEGSDTQKENFYTSMYHLFIHPNNIADVNGMYRGADDNIKKSATNEYYSTFSLWDTYRAAHPLYTILTPEKVVPFVNSMLEHFDAQGYLPIWTLMGKENHCMIGNHAVPIIVESYLKGFKGFDSEKAFQAIKSSLTKNHHNSNWDIYDKYGYYPFDLVHVESVSKTLECVYDDYCAAKFAEALGKEKDFSFFKKRSEYYKNLFDSSTGLMRGKNSSGKWREPFNPFRLSHGGSIGGDYTEGNAWQYTWHVQHDVEGLITLLGGEKKFCKKLDSLYLLTPTVEQTGKVVDVTGIIGQYVHGNEPSHHVAYLHAMAGQPRRTQELVRKIIDTQYKNTPDGLCGNDDCGQMSAWYIFSSIGFYPINPVDGIFWLGAPQLPKIKIKVGENILVVIAHDLSAENKYVGKVMFDGQEYSKPFLSYKQIMKGGKLEFYMTK